MFRRRYIRNLVRSRVIVHTAEGRSIRGLLAGEYTDCVVLEAAEYLEEARTSDVAGRAVIERDKIEWIQELAHASS